MDGWRICREWIPLHVEFSFQKKRYISMKASINLKIGKKRDPERERIYIYK